jgi:hypothetical protein
VTIENRRRWKYRMERARIFPDYARLEATVEKLSSDSRAARDEINRLKSETRSRSVDPSLRATVLDLESSRKKALEDLRTMRAKIAESPEMKSVSEAAREEATAAVKSLRKKMYWGTYQLCEAALNQAASASRGEVAYDLTPNHRLCSRIGNQFIGGMTPADLADSTQMQISPLPEWRLSPSGKQWRPRYNRDAEGNLVPTVLKFRLDSVDRKPLWAEFRVSLDRPFPADARIMQAYVTRRPLRERNPWQYHLCVVLESREFEQTSVEPGRPDGTLAINFGWRQMPTGNLRVATVTGNDGEVRHVELPESFVSGISKCRDLQEILDRRFNDVKKVLRSWLSDCPVDLPPAFRQELASVGQWQSQHRLLEVARYWRDHRVDGDASVWDTVAEWERKYLHLHDWMVNQRRHLLGSRSDLYQRSAKQIVLGCSKIVVDGFCIADVARRKSAEHERDGGQKASSNRVLASPSDLRNMILQASLKYHCQVVEAPTRDGTRRCVECGTVQDVTELVHACVNPECRSSWDQDENNTKNLLERSASGEVTVLISPARVANSGDVVPSARSSVGAARSYLRDSLKIE